MLNPPNGSVDPMQFVKLYGALILELRKDLGYQDTKCDHNDFLNIYAHGLVEIPK